MIREGDLEALTKAIERVMADFKDDPDSLLSFGDFAATTGQVELARKIRALFIDHQWNGETAIHLMEIEALLTAKQYAKALSGIQELLNTPELELQFVNVGQGLQAIAQYGVGDPVAAYLSLTALLSQPNLRSESLLAIADRLLAMGQLKPAREVLDQAVILDPQNQAALSRLVEFYLNAKDMTTMIKNLQILVKMRKPSYELMTRIKTLLKGDNYLFSLIAPNYSKPWNFQ